MTNLDDAKREASRAALVELPDRGVIGLGTGSTARFFIEEVGALVRAGRDLRGVPTSEASREQAEALGIPLLDPDGPWDIDVTVDGADEVDPQLRLIKGGGGALLREKIVASATKQLVIVADASKQVKMLGKFPLPVEVIRFSQALVSKRITALGANVQLRVDNSGKPFVTDENNHILDCHFGEIRDPEALARQLSDMPGVVEHGLFIGMASVALLARGSEIIELKR